MKLKKVPVFIASFVFLALVALASGLCTQWGIVEKCLDSVIVLAGLGFGVNLGEAVQKSVFYKPEMDKND